MKRLLYILLILTTISVATAIDGLSQCTLTGNIYTCTGTITGYDEFNAGTRGIHFDGATVSFSGTTGGTSISGTDANLQFTSSNKILIENSIVSVAGGNGGSANGNSGAAGAGATGTLTVIAPYIKFDSSIITSTGGTGGLGDANILSGCSGTEESDGGNGGSSYFNINGSEQLILGDTEFILNSGSGNTGDAVSCLNIPSSGVNCECFTANGGTGGSGYGNFYYNLLTSTNTNFTGTPGNGGQPDASSCLCKENGGDDEDADAETASAGDLGGIQYSIVGDNASMINTTLDYNFGSTFTNIAVSTASFVGNSDCDHADTALTGAYAIVQHLFKIDSTYFEIENLQGDIRGAIGYDTEAAFGCAGDTCSLSNQIAEGNGGDGQGASIYFYSNNSLSYIKDSYIYNLGGNGGYSDCVAYDNSCSSSGENCGGQSGDGGHFYYYTKNVNITNTNFSSNGGVGQDYQNEGAGGHGGVSLLYNYEESIIDSSVIFDFNGGNGGAGCPSTNFIDCSPGRGGNTVFYNYGDLTIKGWLDFDAGTAGTGGFCNTYLPKGGDAGINNNNTLILTGANVDLSAGAIGASCSEGGDAYLYTEESFTTIDSVILGSALTRGDCAGTFTGYNSFENTTYNCTSTATGVASWIGSNITQWDLRVNNTITMTGTTDDNIDLTYTGDLQKFLIYNSTFDPITVNWNNESCKFTNRTPASVGTVTFNETCYNEVGWDPYYTDISSVSQSWFDGVTEKPLPYSYTNYSCTFNYNYPTDSINNVYGKIEWFVNGTTTNITELITDAVSGVNYTASTHLNNSYVNINDNVSCTFSTPSYLGDTCYQESANETNQTGIDGDCGLDYSGTYVPDAFYDVKMTDGDWSTGSQVLTSGTPNYFIVTFMKPTGAGLVSQGAGLGSQFTYKVKHNDTHNITKVWTIEEDCWEAYDDKMVFELEYFASVHTLEVSCLTPTGSISPSSASVFGSNDNTSVFYEEAMIWYMPTYDTNVTSYEIVVPAYPYNAKIDIGADGSYEYEGTGVFNGTLADTFVKGGINTYIKDNCVSGTCSVPIEFSSDENTTWIFNQVNSSYGSTDTSNRQINFSIAMFSTEAGVITAGDLAFTYNIGDGSLIPVSVPNSTNGLDTLYITMIVSEFTKTLPDNVQYLEIYPSSITSKDVEPVGQTDIQAFYTLSNTHVTEGADIYVRLNKSWSLMNFPCTEMRLNSSTEEFNITDSSQLICDNLTAGEECGVWVYQDLECTWEQITQAVYEPVLMWNILCEECVITQGAFD